MSKNSKPKQSVSKNANSPINPTEIYKDQLEVPEELLKEIKDQGLVCRWVNATELKKNFGHHRSDWRPYICKEAQKYNPNNPFGQDSDGLIRRFDLVLAVKTKQEQASHRQKLSFLNRVYSNFNQQKAEELQDLSKDHGVKSDVIEGWDGDDAS